MKEEKFIPITEIQAKCTYCACVPVFVTTEKRTYWELPAPYCYTSHAPAEELFYRSLPDYEGEIQFFKREKVTVYQYLVEIGIDNFPLEYHEILAQNATEARYIAIGKFLHPDKGMNYISVKRIKKNGGK